MKSKHILPGLLMLAAISAATLSPAQGSGRDAQSAPKKTTHTSASAASAPEDDGERVFAQNCARCHNSPEGFPPRIAGTIVRHMRVRANLSEHDEQALLSYLNP